MTQSITDPEALQPKQWNRFFSGVTINDGVSSPSWNGQPTAQSLPWRTGAYPWLSRSRTSETSRLIRPISSSLSRPMPCPRFTPFRLNPVKGAE